MATNTLTATLDGGANFTIPTIGALTANDWASWGDGTTGTASTTPTDTKSGGGGTISLSVSAASFNNYNAYSLHLKSWTGGTPNASGTNVDAAVYTADPSGTQSWVITAPASTAERKLRIWINTQNTVATASLVAHLSDSSAADSSDTTTFITGSFADKPGYVDVVYAAGSAAQTLTVTFTGISAGGSSNCSIWAAAWAYTSSPDVDVDIDTAGAMGIAGQTVNTSISGDDVNVSIDTAGALTIAGQAGFDATIDISVGIGAMTIAGQSMTVATAGNISVSIDTAGALTIAGQTVAVASTVEVPDVVGDDQATGTATLEGDGFVVSVQNAYSASVAAGDIISQDPEAGEQANSGSTVIIVVSLGTAPAQGDQVRDGRRRGRVIQLFGRG